MEGFVFFLRLGSRVVGRFSADLDTSNTLAAAKGGPAVQSVRSLEFVLSVNKVLGAAGSLTEAAEKALGHKVVIKRFMVTIWGKTGYLHPEQEYAPLTGNSNKLWSSNC